MSQTKIVATLGPASSDREVLARLIDAGVDVMRLNFSHGDHETHRQVAALVRSLAAEKGRPVALLQDLSGPKIRIGRLAEGSLELEEGDELTITTEAVEGTRDLISTTYRELPDDVSSGDRVLLDDGNLELRVTGVEGRQVRCRVVHGGLLRSSKGINLPGVKLSTPALTEKDKDDLRFGLELGVDYVALSFVRAAEDVLECKRLVAELGGEAPVIAKIEKREAVDDLPSVVEAADGLMVARGDLGVEMSTEQVPTLQKRIIEMANGAGKIVITATQMLESMVKSPRPTRAEASDVANAILDGSDAIMLSAETATGQYPVQAVVTMVRIAAYTERELGIRRPVRTTAAGSRVARSLAAVASQVAEELDCKLILAFTETGSTARLMSAYRPAVPIAGITYHERTYRSLSLWWGVEPLLSRAADSVEQMISDGDALLKERGLVVAGDLVLMLVGGHRQIGATNSLLVHVVT